MSYENFMQRYVLNPAGCYDFHIAGNYLKDRRKNETVYYMHSSSVPVPEFNNSGRMVVRCYGENDITTALGAGAWVASAAELCRLVASIDGDRTRRNIATSRETNDAGNARPSVLARLELYATQPSVDTYGFTRWHIGARTALSRRRVLGVHHQHKYMERTQVLARHNGAVRKTTQALWKQNAKTQYVYRLNTFIQQRHLYITKTPKEEGVSKTGTDSVLIPLFMYQLGLILLPLDC